MFTYILRSKRCLPPSRVKSIHLCRAKASKALFGKELFGKVSSPPFLRPDLARETPRKRKKKKQSTRGKWKRREKRAVPNSRVFRFVKHFCVILRRLDGVDRPAWEISQGETRIESWLDTGQIFDSGQTSIGEETPRQLILVPR